MIPKNTLRTDEAQFDLWKKKDFFVNHAHPLTIAKLYKATNSFKNLV